MKAMALLIALLLLSFVFLGCTEQPPQTGNGTTPQLEEQSFDSEEAAFNALEDELESVEDPSAAELEQALQE